jgi:hypothetical protein
VTGELHILLKSDFKGVDKCIDTPEGRSIRMNVSPIVQGPERMHRRLVRRGAHFALILVVLGGCRFMTFGSDFTDIGADGDVASVSGWTRLLTTDKYIAVANVLPGEQMYTDEENHSEHPLVGELILHGTGAPVTAQSRHVEVHVYDRTTGLPVDGLDVTVEVMNLSTGEHLMIPTTAMQDLSIGARDRHYGNNVSIAGPADLRVIVTIDDERLTFDGHLN